MANDKPPKVPRIRGADAIKAFEKAGFSVLRVKGSHWIMGKDGHYYRLSVPVHAGETVGTGLLGDLIEKAGLTVQQFIDLL